MLESPLQDAKTEKITQIDIDRLVPGKYQPRKVFNSIGLSELAASIQEEGILTPLVVRHLASGNYEIIAGERRWRAAQLVQLTTVPCLIGEYTDEQACRIALLENTARQNLNPIEEAEGINRLIVEFEYTHEEAANVLGKPRTEITNLLRLLKLDERVRLLILEGNISGSHGKILAGVTLSKQYDYARYTIAKNWSIRELERHIKQNEQNSLPELKGSIDTNIQWLERRVSEHLGYAVKFDMTSKQKGFVRIQFNSLDELDGIFEKFGYRNNG